MKKRGHHQDNYYHHVKAQAPVVVTTVHPDPEVAMAPSPKYDWEPTGQTRFGHYRDNDTGQYSYGEYPEYQSVDWEVIYPGRGFRAKKDGTPWGKDWEQWTHPTSGEVYWRRPRTRLQTVSSEKMSEIRLGGRKESYMEGRDVDAATATHELGHRFQYSVSSLNDLEHAFLVRRTSAPSPSFPG